MKSLKELFGTEENWMKELSKHPKHKYLEEIYRLVNTQRKSEGYRILPIKVFAIKTAHLDETDYDYLVKRMRASMSPAKVFFGSLKVRKDVAQKV